MIKNYEAVLSNLRNRQIVLMLRYGDSDAYSNHAKHIDVSHDFRIPLRRHAEIATHLGMCSATSDGAQQSTTSIANDEQGTLAGATAVIRLIDSVDLAHSAAGVEFRATLDEPLTAGDHIIVPKGEPATVQLRHSRSGAELILVSLGDPGREVHAEPFPASQLVHPRSTGSYLGKGAVAGALVGGLVMGRIGVGLGAIGGLLAGETVHAVHKERRLPAETRIPFVLTQPVWRE